MEVIFRLSGHISLSDLVFSPLERFSKICSVCGNLSNYNWFKTEHTYDSYYICCEMSMTFCGVREEGELP